MSGVYRLVTDPNTVLRLADNAFIPFEGANRDYQEYLAWLDAGNTPDPIAPLTREEETAILLAGGLTLTSGSMPHLNGTYGVTGADALKINSVMTMLADGSGFPGGATTVAMFDLSGGRHDFDKQSFGKFSRAVRDFVYGCQLYVEGVSSTLPPPTVAIQDIEIELQADVVADLVARVTVLEKR